MDLFDDIITEPINIITHDGMAIYYGKIMSTQNADDYYDRLLNRIQWKNDEVFIHNKHIITKRKFAWYGDKPFEYTYSNSTKRALPWINELKQLKNIVEDKTKETFNSCLLNLYHDGSEGMSWHCDDEKELKKYGAIASLSFGAERKFAFKHKKSKETISLKLQHGSLLIMKGLLQTHWRHSLPTSKKITDPRVNLTFRMFIETD